MVEIESSLTAALHGATLWHHILEDGGNLHPLLFRHEKDPNRERLFARRTRQALDGILNLVDAGVRSSDDNFRSFAIGNGMATATIDLHGYFPAGRKAINLRNIRNRSLQANGWRLRWRSVGLKLRLIQTGVVAARQFFPDLGESHEIDEVGPIILPPRFLNKGENQNIIRRRTTHPEIDFSKINHFRGRSSHVELSWRQSTQIRWGCRQHEQAGGKRATF